MTWIKTLDGMEGGRKVDMRDVIMDYIDGFCGVSEIGERSGMLIQDLKIGRYAANEVRIP